jgi:hypothetical protein
MLLKHLTVRLALLAIVLVNRLQRLLVSILYKLSLLQIHLLSYLEESEPEQRSLDSQV